MESDQSGLADAREGQGNSTGEQPEPVQGTSNVYPFIPPSQLQPYEVFKRKAKAPRLKIRTAGKGRKSLLYPHLIEINSDEAGTKLELISRYLIVRVRGKNLREVIDAIDDHACDFIQEFDPRISVRPDATAPIIEAIEFLEGKPEPDPEANRK